jgi:hypothetical protein
MGSIYNYVLTRPEEPRHLKLIPRLLTSSEMQQTIYRRTEMSVGRKEMELSISMHIKMLLRHDQAVPKPPQRIILL